MKIYMIRHGRSTTNELKVWTGQTDSPLSESGKAELQMQREKTVLPAFDISFSSPLIRCLQSFEILFDSAPDFIIPELKECGFGELEGMPYSEINSDKNYLKWIKNPDFKYSGGESLNEFIKRIKSGIAKLIEISVQKKAKSILLLTHGDVIKAVFSIIKNSDYKSMSVKNGEIYLLEINGKAPDEAF